MSTEEKISPTILVDTPEDCAVEEFGWVPVADAADEAEAIKKLGDLCPVEEDDFAYTVTGRSFHRPYDATGEDGDWFIFDPEGPEERDGRRGYGCEFLTWRDCEPDDPDAVEFWTVELVEREEATHVR